MARQEPAHYRAADRYPHDPRPAALPAELHAGSEEFRQIRQARPVHRCRAPTPRPWTIRRPVRCG